MGWVLSIPFSVILKGISSSASPAGPFFLYRQKEGKERLKGFPLENPRAVGKTAGPPSSGGLTVCARRQILQAVAPASCLDWTTWIFFLGFMGAWCPSFLSCQKGSERTLEKGRGKRPGPSYSCGAIGSSLRGVIAPPALWACGAAVAGGGGRPAAAGHLSAPLRGGTSTERGDVIRR